MVMGTAERREAPEERVAARSTGRQRHGEPGRGGYGQPDRDIPVRGRGRESAGGERRADHRPLWIEEPARRHPMPDPVRTAAVRAVLIIAVTLIQAMVAFLCTMAGSWLAFPMVISSVVSTVVATWAVVDVWVTRQVWHQRYGVVSEPSSTARALRRERRARRRRERAGLREQERAGLREQERIPGGAGQLSHP